MRRVVINADDLGINPSRDHGIFDVLERGMLTSTTMLVNCSDSQRAAELVRRAEFPTGLHLNFTEGFPLSPQKNVQTLLSAEGVFLTSKRFEQALEERSVDPRHIEWEFRAQIEWFIEHRGTPTHMDSHHNVHIHPAVAPILAPLLPQYGSRLTRISEEPPPPDYLDLTDEKRERIERMSRDARDARALYEAHGVRSTDHFRGLAFSGNASKKAFRQMLRSLSEGTTEIMVHPGQCDPNGDAFSKDPQRETEREMLLDEGIPEFLRQQKIELVSYQDV